MSTIGATIFAVPEYADADLKALRESGLRARFSYGAAQGMPNNQVIDLADLKRLHDDWAKLSPDGLTDAGLRLARAGRQQSGDRHPARNLQRRDRGRAPTRPADYGACQRLAPAIGQIDAIAKAGLLSNDMQIIHANKATPTRSRRSRMPARRSAFRRSPNCASASACRRRQNSSMRTFRSACRSIPSNCPAMPTCSAS